MNEKMKSQLKTAFNAPPPARKAEFLQSINFPKISRFDFFIGQIGYIRKRVWIISCMVVITALCGLHFFANENILDLIWIVSSLLPFVSLMTVTEIARSTSYNMAELEMSCKYNFAVIVLSRLAIISCFNIAVFGVIILSFIGTVSLDIFRLGIYLLVPFMLTCSLSLFTLNRFRSRETIYICGSISCFVSIVNTILVNQHTIIFSNEFSSLWGFAFIILTIWTIKEAVKLIKKTEELQWNLL